MFHLHFLTCISHLRPILYFVLCLLTLGGEKSARSAMRRRASDSIAAAQN